MNCLITGASYGIGANLALKMASLGYNLYLTYYSNFKLIKELVNNAATYHDNLIEDKTKFEFMNVLEVNIVGTFLVIKYALTKLTKDSIIINMASTDGIDTYNEYNLDYAVSKAGIIQLTKSLALSLDKKIIAIAPNWVNTESTRMIDKTFLKNELTRINQKKLIEVSKVVEVIIDSINNKEIKNGEVIRIDEN